MDTNDDGVISYEEARADHPDLTEEDFAEIDTNDDGVWSRDELETYLGLTPGCFSCNGDDISGGTVAAIIAIVLAVLGLFFCFSGC